MAVYLQWETLQRNNMRKEFLPNEKNICEFTESHGSKPHDKGIDVNSRSTDHDREKSANYHGDQPNPGIVKTKISRGATGSYYAVFSEEKQSMKDRNTEEEDRTTGSSYQDLMDYNGDEKAVDSLRNFNSFLNGDQRESVVLNASSKRICNGDDQTRIIGDCVANNALNSTKKTEWSQGPGRRHEYLRNSLTTSIRSRRMDIKSEGNFDYSLKNSAPGYKMKDFKTDDHRSSNQPSDRSPGINYLEHKKPTRNSIGAKEGIKTMENLVHQSNQFSQMLKQFKEKENQREKRRYSESTRPSSASSRFIKADKTEPEGDFSSEFNKISPDHSPIIPKEGSMHKMRYPRRKMSYMDSWLQSQHSRISNLVGAVKGDSHDTQRHPPLERAKTFDCNSMQRGGNNNNDHRLRSRESLRRLATFDSDSSLDSARSKRLHFNHLKSYSLDTALSKDSDAESEIPHSDCSDTESFKSLSIASDTEPTILIRKDGEINIGESKRMIVKPDLELSEGLSINEGGVLEGHGSVDISTCERTSVQKFSRQGHPLAVVKPFHLDTENSADARKDILKTDGDRGGIIPSSRPGILETDLDEVMAQCTGDREEMCENLTEMEESRDSNPSGSSLTRTGSVKIAVASVKRREDGKKPVRRGIQLNRPVVQNTNILNQGKEICQGDSVQIKLDLNQLQGNIDDQEKREVGNVGDADSEDNAESERMGMEKFQSILSQFGQLKTSLGDSKGNPTVNKSKKANSGQKKSKFSTVNLAMSKKNENSNGISSPDNTKSNQGERRKTTRNVTRCSLEQEDDLSNLNKERLEYLNEALKPDEDEQDFRTETGSYYTTSSPESSVFSAGESSQFIISGSINETCSSPGANTPTGINMYYRSPSNDIGEDRSSVRSYGSFRQRTPSGSESVMSRGRSYPGSVRESEGESSDEEEKMKTLEDRIRPWNPADSQGRPSSVGTQRDVDETDNAKPKRTIKRQGKGAVDRINKSLSVVMGELKELRRQDLDLAKQLITLGKSIKEFKKHKKEMEEEMLADYLYELESDQYSFDDNYSLNSYDVEFAQQ